MPDEFDIPELDQIGSLMDDLYAAPAASAKVGRAERPANRRRTARRRRFASWTMSQFAEGMNWKNASGFRSSLSTDNARSRLGSVTVGTYSDAMNWRNAIDGPQLILSKGPSSADSGPPDTVSSFFDEMNFE